ncbi:MAG: glycerol-3-phosphate 1-O-acyltransferase PlsY [Clostridia bacterium]|nr:glycerol-3-phosphate 1-O-acyltransferase PlsY [Clostridia bacterium]
MKYLISILIGYLIGTINPAYIISKIRGFDIRKKGSGNAGASNALIVLGKTIGIFCALFDIAKTCFVIWLTGFLFNKTALIFAVTAVACILGHIFPFYMKFKGGKGLACLGGTILMYDWRVFLFMLAGELVVVLMTNYICFVPMSASIVFALIFGILEKEIIGAALFLLTSIVILWKHRLNIQRIRNGTEMHFSYLWNKDKELERVKNNTEK